MNRPDPRLLLSARRLRFVAAGMPLWDVDANLPTVAGELLQAVEGDGWTDLVDVSTPPVRDGRPERADALPMLLQEFHPEAFTLHSCGSQAYMMQNRAGQIVHLISTYAPGFAPTTVLEPWPDLSGLSPQDAARAALVAALEHAGEAEPAWERDAVPDKAEART